ncbi:hypothetical protein JB92DRAFT_3086906 [Gautieria morchelliformis]|nr:hypothetical protein JB92DRAFT_3086906 [Gautieria morchelliformis]
MVRFKNRWLLVEFIPCHSQDNDNAAPRQELNAKVIWLALKQSVMTNFGEVGWGAVSTSLNVKYFSPTTNLCIIRVSREHHQIAWGAVTLLTKINGSHHIPHMVHLSGTIKHAQLAAIRHDREVIARYKARAAEKGAFPDIYTCVIANRKVNIVDPTASSVAYDQYLRQSEQEIEAIQD